MLSFDQVVDTIENFCVYLLEAVVKTLRRMFVYTWNGNLNDLCVYQLLERY